MINSLLSGFGTVLTIEMLLVILAGSVIGYFIGALPGLTPSIGIAILVPITFTMEPAPALILLVSLYVAAEYGGAITAILINAPGTPAAAATAFDGYPLAMNGQAGRALTIAIVSSAVSAFLGAILLIFTAVPMAKMALQFGPLEYFALAIFGLSLISSLSEGSIVKGFIAMFFGLLVISVGIDPIAGVPRFAFTTDLLGGIPFLPALVGLFALSEVLFMLENPEKNTNKVQKLTGIGMTKADFHSIKKTMFIKAPLIGYIVGVIPGAGATIASLISYNEAKRASKDKDSFGKGNIEGIAAAEGANNAAVPGALAPLLALGIPGSASSAILIGALTMQGLQPGPKLFTNNPEIPYSLFAALLISTPIMLILGLFGVRAWVNVVKIPKPILAVVVTGICMVGSYAYDNSMYSVWIMVTFGIIGYFLRKIKVPTTPIVLAMVLGFMMEVNFRRAIIISDGEIGFILSRPISIVFILLSIITLAAPLLQNWKKNKLNLGA